MARKSGTDWGQILLIGVLGGGGLLMVYGYTKWVESGAQGNPVAGTLGSAAGVVINPIESTLQTAGIIAGGATGAAVGYKVGSGIVQSDAFSNLGGDIADWFGNIGSKLFNSGSTITNEAGNIAQETPLPLE